MKGGHLHETTKTWITLVRVRTTAVLQCVVTVTMQPLQAVCSGMKLGYTAEEGAGRGEEECRRATSSIHLRGSFAI